MPAKISFPLTPEYVRYASASGLLAGILSWVRQADPTCLIHPHGFYVVLLQRSGSKDWRFHWWPKGPRTLIGMPAMIHTHDKVVESRILVGQLQNVTYEVTEIAAEGQPVYEVEYLGDKYVRATSNVLRKTERRAEAKVASIQELRAGDCYRIESHVYHEAVIPDETATATLVCMHSQAPGAVCVLGLDGYADRIEFQRTERRAAECTDFG